MPRTGNRTRRSADVASPAFGESGGAGTQPELGDIRMSTPGRPVVPDPTRTAVHRHAECPAWCQGGHENDDWGTELATGLPVRSHQGPSFGRYISTGAEETLGRLDVPTALVFELDGIELSALEMR